MINILQTLQKLRAAVSVLVDLAGSEDVMDEIKNLYFENATLKLCPDEERKFQESKTDFMHFLE